MKLIARIDWLARSLLSRGYVTALYVVVVGMVVAGFIRPLIVFSVLEEQGLFYVALLTTGFMVSRGFASLCTGFLIKERGYRLSGALALFLWCLSIMLYTIVPWQFYPIVRVLEGFSAGLLWPLMQSLVMASVPMEYRSRAMSLYFIAGSIAYNAGIWAGGFIEEYLGQTVLFVFSITLLLAAVIPYTLIAPTHVSRREKSIKKIRMSYMRVFRELSSVIPLVVIVGGMTGLSLDYIMAYAKNVSGYTSILARILWSYTGYAALVVSYIVSYIMDKHPSRSIPLAIGYIVIASLAILSLKLLPEILYMLTILPRVSNTVFKPIIRGYAAKTTSDPELATTAINFLSNISAAFIPLIITSIDTILYIPVLLSPGILVYTIFATLILSLSMFSERKTLS
ncbi:MFS transporter [Desulfurococcaceae archaeon MEX13E-LK6-19]|nr:MFS transporter [Desulfurococcaceae archaeon MEX13E-LK6-19]